jgi:plastocyanin
MEDFSFDPATVTASTSQDIVLVNNGQALHNFSIEGTPIDQDVNPGQTVTLPAPGPSFQPGSYDFFCKYHKAQGMVGTLTATG